MSMSGAIGTYPNRCYRTLIFPAYQSPNLPIYQSTSPQIYQKPMVKKLLSRRYIFYTLLVIAAMAVMARLGVWQLDRRQQRLAHNADLVAKLDATPFSMNDAAVAAQWPLSDVRDEVRNTRANATGTFDFDNEIVLLQQTYNDDLGSHLVAPLVLDGTNKAILVDRGWISVQAAAAAPRASFDTETGQVTVTGFLQPSQILFGKAAERQAAQPAAQESQPEWYRIDIEAIQAQMPYELLPVYLAQSPGPAGNAAMPYRIEPEVDLSEGPHMGYALQWFSFAIIAGVMYLAWVRTREKKAQADAEIEVQAQSAPEVQHV